MLTTLFLALVAGAAPAAQAPPNANAQAETLYTQRCAMCHEAGVSRAANRDALGRLSPDAIRQALTNGPMRTQAAGLETAQIESLARLLGRAATPTGAATPAKRAPAPRASRIPSIARAGTGGAFRRRSIDSSLRRWRSSRPRRCLN